MPVSSSSLEERWLTLFDATPGDAADIQALLRDLQDAAPVHRFGTAVLVTRYADVQAVLRDGVRFSSSPEQGSVVRETRSVLGGDDRQAYDELTAFRRRFMAHQDGDDHRRIRSVAHRAFTPRRIAELAAAAQRYMDELLEPLVKLGAGDLMDVAYRLPLMVIGDLLNVLPQEREWMREWSRPLASHGGRADPEPVREALRSKDRFIEYVGGAAERWRGDPGSSDLVGALMAAEGEARLNSEELAAMFVQLIVAGHETTTNLIGTGIYQLLRHPSQWSLLCADPVRLAPAAAEELLRYVTPIQWRARTAVQDVEIAGMQVAAGTTVFPLLAAANRDPQIFPDPDRIDIERANAGRHLAFGLGPHFCLGASLARLEAAVALRTLAESVPELRLASATVQWTGPANLRRLRRLPVRAARGLTPLHTPRMT